MQSSVHLNMKSSCLYISLHPKQNQTFT